MSTRARSICFAFIGCLLTLQHSARAATPVAARQSSVSSCTYPNDGHGAVQTLPVEESAQASTYEDEVLRLINDARSHGADCGDYGHFAPARPLLMHPLLRCAARKHAQDMGTRQYFSHHSPEGQTPWRRMRDTGYGGYRFAAENIAVGNERPRETIDRLMQDPPHCANIMSPKFTHVGIGYAAGPLHDGISDEEEMYRHITVQDFATPP